MSKKLMSILLALVVMIGMMPMVAMAEVGGTITRAVPTFEDMPEDWSTEALVNAVENGLLEGSNGKILPKENLTRAEMATIINRSFKSYEKASLKGFEDVSSDAWYYDEMAKAVQMKTFRGDGNKLNPNNPISREEAFVVIARAFKVEGSKVSPKGYSDLADISTWAREEVYGLIDAGYVKGSDGKINPKSTITRAEFAQLMFNVVKEYINTPGVNEKVAKGNVMINVPGVALRGATVDGDLIIGDGVGSGDVILDSVNITGRLVVRGGGENSIIIKGTSKVGKVVVARVDGSIRIKTEGDAVVETVLVNDGKNQVVLEGTIKNVEVETNDVLVILDKATIEKVIVSAPEADIKVEKDTEVKSIVIEAAEASIKGTGKVEKVEVKKGGDNSVIETPNTEIVVNNGVTGTTGTGGVEIKEGTTIKNSSDPDKKPGKETTTPPSTGGGGGGGGGGGSTPAPEKTPKEKLADRVAGKVSGIEIPNNAATMDFSRSTKTVTITINNDDASIMNLAGTGAMTILANMDEVTGYDNRVFDNEEKSTIKQWILDDALEKLGKLGISTTLGQLKGKDFTVKVKATVDGTSFTDNYKFIFK